MRNCRHVEVMDSVVVSTPFCIPLRSNGSCQREVWRLFRGLFSLPLLFLEVLWNNNKKRKKDKRMKKKRMEFIELIVIKII